MKKKIHFIVKPISSRKFLRLQKAISTQAKKHNIDCLIRKSLYKGHTIELAENAVVEKAYAVVACGGDGTINEVARVLLKTEIPLGIIPLGSGNGIARHFFLPLNLSKAVAIVFEGKPAKMDVGFFDQKYFFGNLGFGLEAIFIEKYQRYGLHGFLSYCLALLGALVSFKYPRVKIEWNQKSMEVSPFILFFSNLNQQGYNITLTPMAKSNNGKLMLFCMEKSNVFKTIKFFVLTLLNKENKAKEISRIVFSEMKITNLKAGPIAFQMDGEFFETNEKTLDIVVLPQKLTVILPHYKRLLNSI